MHNSSARNRARVHGEAVHAHESGEGEGKGKEDKMGKLKVSDGKQSMKDDENSEGKSKSKRAIEGKKEKEPASLKRGAGDSGNKQSTTKKQKKY